MLTGLRRRPQSGPAQARACARYLLEIIAALGDAKTASIAELAQVLDPHLVEEETGIL